MDIISTEREEEAKKIITELEEERQGKNDSNIIDSLIKNSDKISSNPRGSGETHFSSENKSISVERQDKSEEQIPSSINNINLKDNNEKSKIKSFKISSPQKNKKISKKFQDFLERTEDLQKRRTQNMKDLNQNFEDNLKKIMKEKPEITKRSIIIDKKNSKQQFLERIKDQEIKQKQRKEKLIEKINNEKAKKREEIEKPLEFNIKQKEDKKFMKVYEGMMTRQKEVKERFKIFNEVVQEYKMKECTFAPKINKDREEVKDSSDSDSSDDEKNIKEKMVKRLYNDEIKYRNRLKEKLIKKYKPSFQPKINDNAEKLSRNWKNKLYNKNKSLNHDNNKNNKINASPHKKRMNISATKKKK